MNSTSLYFKALLLLYAVVLLACQHERTGDNAGETCPYDTSLAGMKEWYYFKTGSWWIYQEENTGMMDTVRVYDDFEGFSTNGYDAFSHKVSHSYDGYNIEYYYNSSWDGQSEVNPDCICKQMHKSRFRPGDYVGECSPFLYPNYNGNRGAILDVVNGIWFQGRTTLSFPMSIEIGNNIYSNCAKWKVDADISMNGDSATYILSKNIGIIQIEYPQSNQLWNLLDWHVIQ